MGGKNSVEENHLKTKYPKIRFIGITSGKLRRYFDIRNLFDVANVIAGFFESLFLLIKLRPDAIFSKGGYVAVPICFAGFFLRIPVIIHESDFSLGLANRMIERIARVVCTSFPKKIKEGKEWKYDVTGLPINEVLFLGSKERFEKRTGFTDDLPKMLVMGGSSGASFINQLIWENLNTLLEHIQIVHVYVQGTPPVGSIGRKNYLPINMVYQDVLSDLYAGCDFMLSRCGATSLFEAMSVNIPVIGIPLPLSQSRGDQIENSKFFSKFGALQVLEQDKFTKEEMIKKIIAFSKDKRLQNEMKTIIPRFSGKDSSLKVAKVIMRFL